MIIFTRHAIEKFAVLKRHNFMVSRAQVLKTVLEPDGIDNSRSPLSIAQRRVDDNHALRVVYKKEGQVLKIITFYPARLRKYKL